MESINVVVREGDSFDELYLAFQKPIGTPRDFTNSELLAQIKETFGGNVVDSFGVTKLETDGHLKLALTSTQTEALRRNLAAGYIDRGLLYDVGRQAADPADIGAVYLWDLKELFYEETGKGIDSISQGAVVDAIAGTYRIRVTTNGTHNLSPTDIVRITGTSVSGYNNTYAVNTLSILSSTEFEIIPVGGSPLYSTNAGNGTLRVLKEDTIVLGTLQVKPRITSI
ncbi:hypothetical protein S-CBS4_gp043 [Synechococcus phage S-CBS4]|uniref:hypothetical protein n=1 Tax=Synechococcus phage S-CBS4 TaxID=756275 RepID=UPI000246A703|nr:hypothetical protein S-CBS4_gp043 [Synechococcus phage S-CBS4]AEX56010.1 hypothetical protein S-CBS4_gp043 [Synechococcus phage S-CBS4]AGN30511.1 hypothetical protein SXAG_00064 [Synechococcus phage S-CBS4]